MTTISYSVFTKEDFQISGIQEGFIMLNLKVKASFSIMLRESYVNDFFYGNFNWVVNAYHDTLTKDFGNTLLHITENSNTSPVFNEAGELPKIEEYQNLLKNQMIQMMNQMQFDLNYTWSYKEMIGAVAEQHECTTEFVEMLLNGDI